MMNKTLRNMTVSAAVAALTLSLFTAVSFGQSRTMVANIPFDFYANGKLFEAGSYTVRPIASSGVVRLSNTKGDGVIFATIPTTNRIDGQSRLVFNRYGSISFLSELHWAGYDIGQALPKSAHEKELRAANSTMKVAIIQQK